MVFFVLKIHQKQCLGPHTKGQMVQVYFMINSIILQLPRYWYVIILSKKKLNSIALRNHNSYLLIKYFVEVICINILSFSRFMWKLCSLNCFIVMVWYDDYNRVVYMKPFNKILQLFAKNKPSVFLHFAIFLNQLAQMHISRNGIQFKIAFLWCEGAPTIGYYHHRQRHNDNFL